MCIGERKSFIYKETLLTVQSSDYSYLLRLNIVVVGRREGGTVSVTNIAAGVAPG